MLEINPKQRKSWQSVLPYLEDGAHFVFVPKVNRNKRVIYQVQLWLADSTVVPGKYSYPKKRLLDMGMLQEERKGRYVCWKLKKNSPGASGLSKETLVVQKETQ